MIIHTALFTWKPGTSDTQLREILDLLKELNAIPGIVSIYCGKNEHKESKGYTHGVVVVAETREALDAYRKHPLHDEIVALIEPIEKDGLGFDFEDHVRLS